MKYLLLYLEENYGLTSEKKIQNAVNGGCQREPLSPVRDYLNSCSGTAPSASAIALHHFLGADTDDYTYEACSCSCWEPSHGYSNPAASLKSCSVWLVVKEQESPLSSGCWQSKTNGFPMT
jgi:hypothetical protein